MTVQGVPRYLKQRRPQRQRQRQISNYIGLNWQNNNFARVLGTFLHFFAVTARQRRETS